jgi:hypothetical protein
MGLEYGTPILLLEGVFHSSTEYLVKSWGPKWISDRGFRFHPIEVLLEVVILGLAILAWYILARSAAWLIRHVWLLRCVIIAGAAVAGALAMKLPFARTLYSYRHFTEFAVFPTGMYWLACGVLVWSILMFRRHGTAVSLGLAILAVYAMAMGVRIMAAVEPRNYAIFYNSALFLVFVIVLARVVDYATRFRPAKERSRLFFSLAALYAAWLLLLLMPYPKSYPARLATDRGVIYTRPAEAAVFPRVIAFINQKKAQGQSVDILPEATSIYFFTGTDSPTKWYAINPGVLSPDDEDEFIAELKRKKVDYILLSNRRTSEYDSDYFGLDYNQRLYRWIETNYEVAGQFGAFVREEGSPFGMLIYRRRP